MNHHLSICCAATALFILLSQASADPEPKSAGALVSANEVGEVEIRAVLPLSQQERAELKKITGANAEARALLEERIAAARRWLAAQPRPLAVIHYEGLVHTDPRRMETVQHLEDMDHAALLLEVWQATGDGAFAAQCRRYVTAWAATYRPTGNDVNENKLLPLFTIYETLRAGFAPEEQKQINSWISEIAQKQIENGKRTETRRTNRHTKRLGIVAVIGLALDRQEWLDYAWSGFKEFVEHHLYADGTSFDLKHRDTLTYHSSALQPLIQLAILAKRDGQNLYTWTSPTGSSLKKSVDYVIPFAEGTKQRREWEHSEVELDRRRAAAGLKEYQPGSLYNPKSARPLLEEAAFFEPALAPLVARLAGSKATRFPTWRTVLNDACHQSLTVKTD